MLSLDFRETLGVKNMPGKLRSGDHIYFRMESIEESETGIIHQFQWCCPALQLPVSFVRNGDNPPVVSPPEVFSL